MSSQSNTNFETPADKMNAAHEQLDDEVAPAPVVEAPKKEKKKRTVKVTAAAPPPAKTAEEEEEERRVAEEAARQKEKEEEERLAAEYEAEQSRRKAEEEVEEKKETPKKKKAPAKPKVKRAIVECEDCHEDFTVEGESKAVRCPECETKHRTAHPAAGGGRPVAIARTLAAGKAALPDARLAELVAEATGEVAVALAELVEFRRVAEEKRLRANELSKKSKAKAKNGGGGGDGEGGEGGGGEGPKESKAVRDAKMIAAYTADAVVKKMKEDD
jgi:ribosomal protein S27E